MEKCIDKLLCLRCAYPQHVHYGAFACRECGYTVSMGLLAYPLSRCVGLIDETVSLVNWLCARFEPEGLWIDNESLNAALLLSLGITFFSIQEKAAKIDLDGIKEVLRRAAKYIVVRSNQRPISALERSALIMTVSVLKDPSVFRGLEKTEYNRLSMSDPCDVVFSAGSFSECKGDCFEAFNLFTEEFSNGRAELKRFFAIGQRVF